MNISFDAQKVNISLSRFRQLQRDFNKNYEGVARDVFNSLDKDIKMSLLDAELMFDKQFLTITGHHSTPRLGYAIKEKNIPYLYTPSFDALPSKSSAQIHIRHNAYRTLAVMLMDNCTIEEKVVILSRSFAGVHFKNQDFLRLAGTRLSSLMDMLHAHTL